MTIKDIHHGLRRRLAAGRLPRPVKPSRSPRAARAAAVLALLSVTMLMQAGAAHADGQPAVTPPAQSQPDTGQRGLGFVPNPAAIPSTQVRTQSPSSLPSSADLSAFIPPVGNQGGVESCTAWATGYYLRGWYARRNGYYPSGGSDGAGSVEPMYTYAQIVKGANVGTSFAANLNIQQSQGLDTRADYYQGDYDYTTQPTLAETTNAAFFKIWTYNDVGNGGGTSLQNWIESSIASGNPVAIAIPVYPEFDHVSGPNWLVTPPLPGETSRGNHAVFAYKYDANGLWIENSWGTGWGNSGFAELSWSFVNQYSYEAVNIGTIDNGLVSGYVWANSPTSSSYTPSTSYQFNSSGATNTITRYGVGNYTVAFPNLGVNGGTVRVTAYGSAAAACKVAYWWPIGTTQDVNVRCFNAAGAPADAYYTASFARPQSAAHTLAYVWANSPTSSSYTPSLAYQFNSSGAVNTITRLGTGSYQVQLPNLGSGNYLFAPGGHVEVTAYGSDSTRCQSSTWGHSGTTEQVDVLCFNAAGAPVDTMFTMTFVNGTSLDGGPGSTSAYVWANSPTSPSYTPSAPYQFNSSGATNTITRLGTGSYTVSVPNQFLYVGDVQVTAYGSTANACQVTYWASSGVGVMCFNSSGAPADSYFNMTFFDN